MMESQKPKGFGEFDSLMRKLVKVDPSELESGMNGVIDDIVKAVSELPDRSSPDDWPEAMLVTAEELRSILGRFLTPIESIGFVCGPTAGCGKTFIIKRGQSATCPHCGKEYGVILK